jgi:hypothetical protein
MSQGRPARRPVAPAVGDNVYDVPAPDIAAVPPLTLLESAFKRIGFSETGARKLCSIEGENVTLEALSYMDNKVVETLCQNMRKPGGGENGVVVSTSAEMALYVVCYMARHYKRTSRTMTEAGITLEEVESFSKRRINEEGYKEPTEKMKLSKPEKIMDFIEEWPEH